MSADFPISLAPFDLAASEPARGIASGNNATSIHTFAPRTRCNLCTPRTFVLAAGRDNAAELELILMHDNIPPAELPVSDKYFVGIRQFLLDVSLPS